MALLLTMVLVIACGSGTNPSQPAAQTSPNTHAVEHAMGTTLVPNQPSRVVVLDTAPLDAAIALGITPVGARVHRKFPDYLEEHTGSIVNVSASGQPSLEAIIKLHPDLILSNKVSSAKVYPLLSQIAPTVLAEDTGRIGDWPKQLRLYGEALGRGDIVEEILADYQGQLRDLRQRFGIANKTISVVFAWQHYVGFYSDTSFPGSVLSGMGFQRPLIQTQSTLAPHLSIVSKETFQDLDGDVIFLMLDEDDVLTYDSFMQDPLFSRLSAVRNKQVYPVQSAVWAGGRNILAAQQILQDVTEALMNGSTG
ncbi:MAG: iron-siderophore ABC transporter substrate-binding protein [Cyanobacteria bacterium P01_C01_bin.89]